MLYLSTRNQNIQYTAPQTFLSDRAPDGGFFRPMALKPIEPGEIAAMMGKSFGDNVAAILCLFFPVRITGWNVDCAIGRKAVRLHPMNRTVVVAECWHDLSGTYESIEKNIYCLIKPDNAPEKPCLWPRIAIRTAVIFGIYAQMQSLKMPHADISLYSEDFSLPMSACYASHLGLAMGKIICCSQETSGLWDLFKHGSCSGAAKKPACFEMLLSETASSNAVEHYWNSGEHASFSLEDDDLRNASEGIHVSVVTKPRSHLVVGTVFAADRFIVDTDTAFTFSGVQDYRAESGTNAVTLLISDKDPKMEAAVIERSTGLSHEQFLKHLQDNGV